MLMRRGFRRLGKRGNSGSAAVEFALIAPVFFLLLFAIFETGMLFFADMTLENGVATTARLIRTGQAQTSAMTQAQYRTALCNEISFLLSCNASQLYIDVRSFTNFNGANYPQALNNGILNPNLNSWQPGGSSQVVGQNPIVLVRVFYEWPLFTPLFGAYFANMAGNVRLLSASRAFKNEPF